MGKMHIGKGGIARPCVAQPGNCPYGGAEAHWETLEEADAVAQNINKQLASIKGFGIAKVGGFAVPNESTKKAILNLANLEQKVKKLDAFKKKARQQILNELKSKGIKSVDIPEAKITFIQGGKPRKSIDRDLFDKDESLNHADYLKQVNVKGSLAAENTDAKTQAWSKKNLKDLPDFEFTATAGEGDPTISESSKENIKRLKAVEDKIKEAQQLQKDIKANIKEKMDEVGVKELKLGKIKFTSKSAHTREQVDTKALRAANLYENYVKTSLSKDSVRLTYRKV